MISDEADGDDPVHIGGCMRYGDNVEDEWIALSILVSLTRSYSNIIARAWDCDGEVSDNFCTQMWEGVSFTFTAIGVSDRGGGTSSGMA
jgi:hypothetical protein